MAEKLKNYLGKFRLYREWAYLTALVIVTGKYLLDLVLCGWDGMLVGFDNATHDWKRQVFTIGWAREKIEGSVIKGRDGE